MAQRQSLCGAHIKQDVAIDIDDMAALGLLVFSKRVDLGCILVSAQIVPPENRFVPRARQIGARGLSLCKGSTAGPVVYRSHHEIEFAGNFAFNHSKHFFFLSIYLFTRSQLGEHVFPCLPLSAYILFIVLLI